MEKIFKVGIISSSHGVHGEAKIFPTTDDPSRFKKLKEIILDTGKSMETKKVLSVRFSKNMVLLKLEGIDTPEAVMALKGRELYVPRENAVRLRKDEYFIADMIGISVYTEDGELFGTLKDIFPTGANDVYVVDHDGKEVLLPAIKECILSVDVENERMDIHLMEGLLDL